MTQFIKAFPLVLLLVAGCAGAGKNIHPLRTIEDRLGTNTRLN